MAATRLWLAGILSLLAACGGDGIAPVLPPCTASGAPLQLAVGEFRSLDPGATSGCTVFPAAVSGAEYLLVAQSASAKPNDSQDFRLAGAVGPAAAPTPQRVAPQALAASPEVAERFHYSLRRVERELAVAGAPRRALPAGQALRAARVVPVDSGHVRTFRVCLTLECDTRNANTLTTVTGTAQKVGPHIAIYVDDSAPSGGLTQADLNALRDVFENRLYAVDTTAFGRESDIDGNGQVIVLMTNKVNELVSTSECASGFVVGFFFGADLLSPSQRGTGNNGEIFYTLVADPVPTLNSCAHQASEVREIVPTTLAHEFQHMISFSQHFLLRGGAPETLWLNEALSHYAEERAGRSFLEPAPGDSTTFCAYVRGNLRNAGGYLAAPQEYFVVDTDGIGGTTERGAYWLLLRYVIDQFAASATLASADDFTRTLVETSDTGATNLERATGGAAFATLLSRWAVALWVSDLEGFAAPPELRYRTWAFRSDFGRMGMKCVRGGIPATFPLDPDFGPGSGIALSGVLRAGTGTYFRAQQSADAPGFTLLFTDGTGRALRRTLVPRLNVIRIQ